MCDAQIGVGSFSVQVNSKLNVITRVGTMLGSTSTLELQMYVQGWGRGTEVIRLSGLPELEKLDERQEIACLPSSCRECAVRPDIAHSEPSPIC